VWLIIENKGESFFCVLTPFYGIFIRRRRPRSFSICNRLCSNAAEKQPRKRPNRTHIIIILIAFRQHSLVCFEASIKECVCSINVAHFSCIEAYFLGSAQFGARSRISNGSPKNEIKEECLEVNLNVCKMMDVFFFSSCLLLAYNVNVYMLEFIFINGAFFNSLFRINSSTNNSNNNNNNNNNEM